MTLPHLIMWLIVFAVGVPSAWRNLTALALVISWLVGELAWLVTGNNLPLSVYFMADVAVIAIIYAKTIRRVGAKTYASSWQQLRCLITDLTVYDRWVAALFLLGAWPLYTLNVNPWTKWWCLWALVIAQFLIASLESLAGFRASRHKEQAATIIDRHLYANVIPFPRRAAERVLLMTANGGGGSG